MARMLPFINEKSGGRYVVTNKGNLSPVLQRRAGDVLFNDGGGRIWAVECKTEEVDKHGNFFLEHWSNKCFRHQKDGWMRTQRADILLYHFLEPGDLYSISF